MLLWRALPLLAALLIRPYRGLSSLLLPLLPLSLSDVTSPLILLLLLPPCGIGLSVSVSTESIDRSGFCNRSFERCMPIGLCVLLLLMLS